MTTLRGAIRSGHHLIGPWPQPLRRKASSSRASAIEDVIWSASPRERCRRLIAHPPPRPQSNEDGQVSISRRGLLAVGLTAAVVGSIGVASMINANADDGIDGGTPVAAVTSDAPADPGTIVRNDDGTEAIVPPSTTLPWGEQPTKMRVGRMGASAAELAATGAVAARDDSSRQPHPEFGPKGKFLRNNRVLTEQETTVVPGPVPPAPPAERGDPVIGSPKDVYYSYALARTPDPSQARNPLKSVDGASANLVIGRPYLDKADWHTLSEIAVQSADGQQTIEVGWTVDRAVNGDEDPHLFVFSWVDGVPSCYNSCNYLPAKGASIKPGDTLAVNTVRNFGIQHIGNVWWVAIDSEWIGAFMDDTWGNKFTQA